MNDPLWEFDFKLIRAGDSLFYVLYVYGMTAAVVFLEIFFMIGTAMRRGFLGSESVPANDAIRWQPQEGRSPPLQLSRRDVDGNS